MARLLSLKLLPIPYLMYFSMLTTIPFYLTFNNGSITWKMPPVDTTQESALFDSLATCLMQRVTMVILAGYVCRWSLKQLTASAIIQKLNQEWFLILSICIFVFSLGSSPFESITHDWGVLFYFLSAQVMNSIRTAAQGMY